MAGMARDGDGIGVVLAQFAVWTVVWTALFYGLVRAFPYIEERLGRSCKEHENDRYWVARNISGSIHAFLVSVFVLPAFASISASPDEVRFAYAPAHLATCYSPSMEAAGFGQWNLPCEAVAVTGIAFVAFTFADVFISGAHGMATVDYMVHHFAFIICGIVIRTHCMVPFNASALLSMEISTPFLNTLLLLRNRGDAYAGSIPVLGMCFFVLYVLFRLIASVYAAVVLALAGSSAMPPHMPAWQAWILYVAILAGTAVQFFWFPKIAKTFGAGILDLLRGGGDGSAEEGQCLGKRNPQHQLLSVEPSDSTTGS